MAARLVAQVLDGHDAVVVGPGDSASFLRDVVPRLEDRGCRVFHVTAPSPGGLGLSALLAEVAGQPDLEAHDDDTLERGFQRLTVPGPGCDRIVLVIDGADRLHDPVFRYLALARKAADELQFVLAGQTDPAARPGEAVAPLHARLTAQPAFHLEPVPAALPGPPPPASVLAGSTTDDAPGVGAAPANQDNRKQRAVWIVAALGMAVSAVIGFGVGRQAGSGDRTGPDAPAASTRNAPVNPPGQVGPAPVPLGPNPGSPVPQAAVAPPLPSTPPAPVPPVAIERAPDPPSTAMPPADPKPAAAEPPPPPHATALPEPDQPSAPPADAPPPAAPEHPTVPPSVPAPQNAGQDRESQAILPPPHVRSAVPGAGRTRPASDGGEHRPHDQSRRPSEAAVGEFPPQGASPSGNRPVIGSFVVGPDGTRVFRPNP